MKNLYLLLLFGSGIAMGQPIIQQPSDLQVCDINSDLIAPIDLTLAVAEILGPLDSADHTLGFFETQTAAENFQNVIMEPQNYLNIIPGVQTIYVGVFENSNPALVATTSFEAIVNLTPMVWPLQPLVIAEDPFDGTAIFDLTSQSATIINGQANILVQFHVSEADAESNVNVIFNAATFTNTSNPQTIWVRSENTVTGCFDVGSIDLHVIENNFINFPDANLKTRLLQVGGTYPTALNVNNEYVILDATGDGQIQYGEALLAGTLYLSGQGITNMEGIQYFTNLRYLSMPANSVTTLDVSTLVNLINLECYSNDLTALELGNINIESITCYDNDLPVLDVTNQPNLQYLWCFGNNLTELDISQNTQLINLQCDDNQLTELDLSTVNLSVLGCGHNPLTEIDLSGQTNLVSMNCDATLFTTLDLAANTGLTWISCANNLLPTVDVSHLTNLQALITGGQVLQTIFMKNGASQDFELTDSPNLEFICVDEVEGALVQTAVNASTSPDVVVNSYCTFTPGGDYNTITGIVSFDANANGPDAGDPLFPLVKVGISGVDGNGASFTNTNGSYSFYVEDGTYSLAPEFENQNYFDLFLPVAVNFPTVDNSVVTQNFSIVANGIHPDVEIVVTPVVPSQPGFDAVYKIVYRNKGNQIVFGSLLFNFDDDRMDFVSATETVFAISPGQISFNGFVDLLPFENREVTVTLNINAPTDTPPVNIGDVLNFSVSAFVQGFDVNEADNHFTYDETVIGSFDPNAILCIEGDVVATDQIGEYLHYFIQFENTGTAPAQNIVVRDIIDPTQFDVSSIQLMNASHAVTARQDGNVLECIFQGINLDSGGHGNILMKVKSLPTLTAGAAVVNRADIFFDYNFPIATNDALTSFESLGISDPGKTLELTCFPNPTSDRITLKSPKIIEQISLYDVQGRLLQTTYGGSDSIILDLSDRQTGVYFIKAISGKEHSFLKIMKN